MRHHIVPLRIYYAVFGALLVLTAVTVYVAFLDLGPLNTLVAVTIAVVKALLVLLFFMHVRYSSHLIWVYAGAGILWLLILFSLTLSDYFSRGWIPVPPGLS
jgi:cytochrome c oxidase subunit 4